MSTATLATDTVRSVDVQPGDILASNSLTGSLRVTYVLSVNPDPTTGRTVLTVLEGQCWDVERRITFDAGQQVRRLQTGEQS